MASGEVKKQLARAAVVRALEVLEDVDAEQGHRIADDLLLNFIEELLDGDTTVTKAFKKLTRWYS